MGFVVEEQIRLVYLVLFKGYFELPIRGYLNRWTLGSTVIGIIYHNAACLSIDSSSNLKTSYMIAVMPSDIVPNGGTSTDRMFIFLPN